MTPSNPSWPTRRHIVKSTGLLGLSACAGQAHQRNQVSRPRTVLLRSSWQTQNIGDIAHTPGLLGLIEKHLPDVDVILWPEAVDHGVGEMLHAAFPRLQIVYGDLNAEGSPLDRGLSEAFATADLFIHGSGSGLPGFRQLQAWKRATRKPFGLFGVSLWDFPPDVRNLLEGAAFIFCRDTKSVENVRRQFPKAPYVAFGPDAAFGMQLRDNERAGQFLAAHKLANKQFLCVVPRLRRTPYHEIRRLDWDDEEVAGLERDNARFAEADHAKLRTLIEAWVSQTGNKVLLAPEMTYQLGLLGPYLFDPLPAAVKKHVELRRTYWFPDEAASVYAQASAVVSLEMHSPILALMADTPAFYVRQPSDTIKGQMWRDIGLASWTFEVDQATGEELAQTVISAVKDAPDTQKRVKMAQALVRERHSLAMQVVDNVLPRSIAR